MSLKTISRIRISSKIGASKIIDKAYKTIDMSGFLKQIITVQNIIHKKEKSRLLSFNNCTLFCTIRQRTKKNEAKPKDSIFKRMSSAKYSGNSIPCVVISEIEIMPQNKVLKSATPHFL